MDKSHKAQLGRSYLVLVRINIHEIPDAKKSARVACPKYYFLIDPVLQLLSVYTIQSRCSMTLSKNLKRLDRTRDIRYTIIPYHDPIPSIGNE